MFLSFSSPKNPGRIFLFILAAINILIKGIGLTKASIDVDEPFSIYYAQFPISSIIRELSQGNNPPLYEILLRFWINLFGISTFSVRLPSLIATSVTAVYLYLFGKKFISRETGLLASVVFIFSNYHTMLAHEARSYALLGTLSVVSMYYFAIWIWEENFRLRKSFFLWTGSNILIIYLHFFGFFILFVQYIFLFSNFARVGKHYSKILFSLFLLLLFYSPYVPVLTERFFVSASEGTWVTPPNGLESIYETLRKFSNEPVVAVIIISVLLISSFKNILLHKQGSKFFSPRFLVIFWFFFIFFFMFGISYKIPMFMERYLMPAAVSFGLVVGVAIETLFKNPKKKQGTFLLIALLYVVSTDVYATNSRNSREIVKKIKQLKKENTIVLFCPKHFVYNFTYHYAKNLFKSSRLDIIFRKLKEKHIYGINHIQEFPEKFLSSEHILYLDAGADFSAPGNNILPVLNSRKKLIKLHNVPPKYKIYEYVIP